MNDIIARLEKLKNDVFRLQPDYDHRIGHSGKANGFACCEKGGHYLALALACLKDARGILGIKED